MLKFGVSNLRRLESIAPIELRPITLLVGRNSSGKSTFLRSLPLLRQSLSTRISSPILWYGDWVDFGGFDGAVINNDTEKDITFWLVVERLDASSSYLFEGDIGHSGISGRYIDVDVAISISKYNNGTRVSRIELSESSNGVKFDLDISQDGKIARFLIDGADALAEFSDPHFYISLGSLFPTLNTRRYITRGTTSGFVARETQYLTRPAIAQIVSRYIDKRIRPETTLGLVDSILQLTQISPETLRIQTESSSNRSWKKFVREITASPDNFQYIRIRRVMLISTLSSILSSLSSYFKVLSSLVLYMGPARARSDRYYRYQDLEVSEIDPDGKNFPMFLNSLRERQIASFSSWVERLFGYGVHVIRDSGHIRIELKYGQSSSINIVDTGYGVSQILPVLGQVWWAANGPQARNVGAFLRTNQVPQIIAIEQPELHLHPAHQALLADTFVEGLKERPGSSDRLTPHFILETHSEAMINRFGALVASGQLNKDKIQVVIFEGKGGSDETTTTSLAKFDDDGHLVNWPYDFFIPTEL